MFLWKNHFDPKNDDLADWFSGSPDWVRRSQILKTNKAKSIVAIIKIKMNHKLALKDSHLNIVK